MTKLPSVLVEGYQIFFNAHFSENRSHYEALAFNGQKPKTMVIACCDSRINPENIFNCAPGEMFVIRNIANQIPPFQPDGEYHGTSAALEYAVQALEVEHIVVLGHASCGGIKTALDLKSQPLSSDDFIGRWMDLLGPMAIDVATNPHLSMQERQTALERLSISRSLANLRTFPWILEREKKGLITLHGLWFCIPTGELWSLDEESQSFHPLEKTAVPAKAFGHYHVP